MMFKEILTALISAEKAKDEAKARWLELSGAGDDGQHDARRTFLQADDRFATQADALAGEIRRVRELGMLELVMDSLGEELSAGLHRLVAKLGIDMRDDQVGPSGLTELVRAWRGAAALLDAAMRINQLRAGCESSRYDDLLNASESWRNPAAWTQAASACRLILSLGESGDGDIDERMADATHAVVRFARRSHDRLTELLRDKLEELVAHNMLSLELEDIEPDVRRCVQELAGSGFIRQRQTQTQPETRAQSVITRPTAE
jgi:hypothetical protein